MGISKPRAIVLVSCTFLGACGSCSSKTEPSPTASPSVSASVVAEALPRCRGDAPRLALSPEVVVGDVAIGPAGLLVGLIREEGGKRVASVLRAPLDLAKSRIVDVGPPLGDDPPPSPRWNGDVAQVAFIARHPSDGGLKLRELRIVRLEDERVGVTGATIPQQADESTAFDLAWSEGSGLVAWDEDAPFAADAAPSDARGFVKVQVLGSDARRVASPETSDADSPRLVARPGGYWLAWLARRTDDDPSHTTVEGPGEKRAFSWVEVVPLGKAGEATGPVKRVGPEKGRAVSFDVAREGADLAVIVQDETAPAEGAGGRIVKYVVAGDRPQAAELVDGGVGHAFADLVPSTDAARFVAWTDTAEKTHLTPLGAARSTSEPSLDGARVLATNGEHLYALTTSNPPELRRFICK